MLDCIACGQKISSFGDELYCEKCTNNSKHLRFKQRILLFLMSFILLLLIGILFWTKPQKVETRFGPFVRQASRRVLADPQDQGAQLALATAFMEQNAYHEAIPILSVLIQQQPQSSSFLQLRAEAHIQRHDFHSAINDLELLISKHPLFSSNAYLVLGDAYASIESWHAAKENYLAAIALDSENSELERKIAHVFQEINDFQSAAFHLERSLLLRPNQSECLLLRNKLTLFRAEAGILDLLVPGIDSIEVPLTQWSNIFTTIVILDNNIPAQLVFDTGASITTITSELAHSLGYTEKDVLGSINAASAAGPISLPMIKLQNIAIGELIIHDIEVGICDACGMGGLDGLLGLNFIENFIIEFDVHNQILNLHPRQTLTNNISNIQTQERQAFLAR